MEPRWYPVPEWRHPIGLEMRGNFRWGAATDTMREIYVLLYLGSFSGPYPKKRACESKKNRDGRIPRHGPVHCTSQSGEKE